MDQSGDNDEKQHRRFCITVLGFIQHGKTSLIERFALGTYDEDRQPKDGGADPVIENTPAKVPWGSKEYQVNLVCRNTSRFVTQTNVEYKMAQCFIVLYDQSDEMSLECIRKELEEMERFSRDKIPIVVVAGKCDLQEEVDRDEAQKLAKEYNAAWMAASAKTGEGVKEVFDKCMELLQKDSSLNGDNTSDHSETNGSKENVELETPIRRSGACILI